MIGHSSAQIPQLTGKYNCYDDKPEYETALAYVTMNGEFVTGAFFISDRHVLAMLKKDGLIQINIRTTKNLIRVMIGCALSSPNSCTPFNVSDIARENAMYPDDDLAVITVSSIQNLRLKAMHDISDPYLTDTYFSSLKFPH